jgi:hypothetical protein
MSRYLPSYKYILIYVAWLPTDFSKIDNVANLVKTYPIVLSKSKVPSVSEKKLKALKQIKKEFEREYKHL